MLGFLIISGLITTGVDCTCSVLRSNYKKKRGYVQNNYDSSLIKNGLFSDLTLSMLLNFIPPANILYSIKNVKTTGSILISPTTEKDRKAFGRLENVVTSIKRDYDYYDRQLEGIEDALKLDGATPEVIKQEVKNAEESVYSSKVKLSDSKRRELDAMSNAELWLRDMELECGLSSEERGELFFQYTQDFMNTKDNAKPKAIEKTLKLINRR